MKIYLIGFMGSGKSSVGKNLATSLGISFFDTDSYIEEYTEKAIPAIFADEGEEGFRHYESNALEQLSGIEAVVATGGGIIEKTRNKDIMDEDGIIVYLHTNFETISQRLQEDKNRPLWNQDLNKRKALYERRLPMYKQFSHYIVETDDKEVEDIIYEIEDVMKFS
ncbi:shikimate kinase [Pontibacillus yanchengensis]|nr:shikimate kinase [Pontibacillus yanchengensis]